MHIFKEIYYKEKSSPKDNGNFNTACQTLSSNGKRGEGGQGFNLAVHIGRAS